MTSVGKIRWGLSALGACALMGVAGIAGAAPPAAPPAAPDAPVGQPTVRVEDLPAPVRLGLRVATVRSRLPVALRVVVVPDGDSYLAAIGAWTPQLRFPVLIDDGSWAAREAIARFVRAFEPREVVRFRADAVEGEGGRRAEIERVVAAAWGCAESAKLHDHWRELGLTPPGVVIADADDPAWTAAAALAAGHGQPIVWLNARPGGAGVSDWFTIEKLDELSGALEAELAKLPWPWEGLGDGIDAVTLCQNGPVKAAVGNASQNTTYAVTDVLGRPVGAVGAPAGDARRLARWAWAGQVIGGEWQAAYAAMCSLFLSPRGAWLFDGYDADAPWGRFDATTAARAMEPTGMRVLLDDDGRRGAEDWRRRAAGEPRGEERRAQDQDVPKGLLAFRRGVDAGLIFVNTSGNADFFDLKPGQCRPGDVPVLSVPSLVHFVHSWSATAPGDRATVGGRWLERGAFAYLGSVYEPYLHAFMPTPLAAQRLLSAAAFGAAVRHERAEPWKLAVLGDPLYVVVRAQPRTDAPLPDAMAGAENVAVGLAGLKDGDFVGGLEALRLLGRDRDAARLLAAIIRDEPAKLTEEAALAGLSAAFFGATPEVFAEVYGAAIGRIEKDEGLAGARDMLWHALYTRGGAMTVPEADLLARSLRPDSLARDAAEAARVVHRARGAAAAREVIDRALLMAPDEATRAEIARWAP